MNLLVYFGLAFGFSFIGSIPPGTINLTLLQLGMQRKTTAAFKFALAASLIEYPYAWIAIKFENIIISSPSINQNLTLFASLVMIILGVAGLVPARERNASIQSTGSGFRKGLLIGILNPLAIPYWIGITAYLRSEHIISALDGAPLQAYLLGIVLGAICLLSIVIIMSEKLSARFSGTSGIKKIPGVLLILLGVISLLKYYMANY